MIHVAYRPYIIKLLKCEYHICVRTLSYATLQQQIDVAPALSVLLSIALSPGSRNDRLVHTVMRMRLIFLMNIHKNHCIGGAC